jgi:hypothetical protein
MRGFFLVHQFSHNLKENYSVISKVLEQKDLKAKNIPLVKKPIQKTQDDDNFCLICHLTSIYQNNVIAVGVFILALALFLIARFLALSNKIRLSYLLSSYLSQAPPKFS